MGDSGSNFLGYILSVLPIFLIFKQYEFNPLNISYESGQFYVVFFTFFILYFLPILDSIAAVTRRLLGRKKLYHGDRGHFYDIIFQKTGNHFKTVISIYLLTAFQGILAVVYFQDSFDCTTSNVFEL